MGRPAYSASGIVRSLSVAVIDSATTSIAWPMASGDVSRLYDRQHALKVNEGRRQRDRPVRSAGPVARVDESAVVEVPLLDQLEVEAHTVGEEPCAAADHARGDEQVVLVR